ncbi:MAG: rcsC 4 [Firmicutes bacterium]|nr:rcsC 4 [Bacillota bacterium]
MRHLSVKVYYSLVILLSAGGMALLFHAIAQGFSLLPLVTACLLLTLGLLGAWRLYDGLQRTIRCLEQAVSGGDDREADQEKRVQERTKSLVRHNMELAIINRLITPIFPPNETAQVIEKCLAEFREIANVNVKLVFFSRPIRQSLKREANLLCEDAWIADANGAPCLMPIRSSELDFGYLSLDDTDLDETDRQFLQTLAHSAGVIMQNEILLRTNQEKHAVLKAVLESIYDGITWTNNKGIVIYANQRMAKLFDIVPERLRGATEDELFRLIANVRMSESADTVDSIKTKYGAYQLRIRTENGRERFLNVSVFPVTAAEGGILGRGYLFRDVTKLYEIDKLKSDLVSLVSHEFKTPITSIKGSVETLLRQDAVWEEAFKQELLQGIHEDIGRIRELVDDWLDLSKIAAGAIGLKKEAVRVYTVVDNAIRHLPKHFAQGAVIENNVMEELPLINGDRVRLEQVVANLLTNAIRYNDRTPHIQISAVSAGQFVRIAIADNGIGIGSEALGHIFERLPQTDTGHQRRDGGTGLGLAICKGIMQAHGGEILAESTEDVGSVFTISIPKFDYRAGEKHE